MKCTGKSVVITEPKLRKYVMYKLNYMLENYIKTNNKCERSILAKIRCGRLKLKVETGRFNNNTPLNERICAFCNYGLIEDEKHVVCVCPLYEVERRTFYTKLSNVDQSLNVNLQSPPDIFIYVMTKSDRT